MPSYLSFLAEGTGGPLTTLASGRVVPQDTRTQQQITLGNYWNDAMSGDATNPASVAAREWFKKNAPDKLPALKQANPDLFISDAQLKAKQSAMDAQQAQWDAQARASGTPFLSDFPGGMAPLANPPVDPKWYLPTNAATGKQYTIQEVLAAVDPKSQRAQDLRTWLALHPEAATAPPSAPPPSPAGQAPIAPPMAAPSPAPRPMPMPRPTAPRIPSFSPILSGLNRQPMATPMRLNPGLPSPAIPTPKASPLQAPRLPGFYSIYNAPRY